MWQPALSHGSVQSPDVAFSEHALLGVAVPETNRERLARLTNLRI
jgi:hypothetical protein